MIEAASDKKFQIILCKSQSRFTRDMELVEKYIHGLFPIWGIRFIALADNADTEIKGNKKARQINGLINEWYLEDLSENIRTVFDMKRRQGQYIGGSPVYGYRKDPENKNRLIIDPEAAAVVRQVFQWALDGHGKQSIASMLNSRGIVNPSRYKMERGLVCNHPVKNDSPLWNKTTVWRILHNEMYIGNMVQGRAKKISYKSKTIVSVPPEEWFRVEGTHEAIVDTDTFYTVQDLMALRTRQDGTGIVHPLAGLVKCMDCGSTMSKSSNGKGGARQVFYLRCKRYAESGAVKLCSRHSIRLDRLIDLVWERLRYYIQIHFPMECADIPQPSDRQKDALLHEKKVLSSQLEKRRLALKSLYLDKISGILSEAQFVELNRDFLAEKNRLEHRLRQISGELAKREHPDEKEDFSEKAREFLQSSTLPRELAVALIEKVEIGETDPDTGEQAVKITWKF